MLFYLLADAMSVSRKELFSVWYSETNVSEKVCAVYNFVMEKLKPQNVEMSKVKIKTICSKFLHKWRQCKRAKEIFKKKHSNWLNGAENFSFSSAVETRTFSGFGRPRKDFNESSLKTKKRRVEKLVNEHSTEILSFATESSLRLSGQRNAAEMVKEVTSFSPKRASKIKKAYAFPPRLPSKYTPEEALALYVEGKFTKAQYIAIQSGAKLHGANIYPPYHVLKLAKKECYPPDDMMKIADISAEIKLQALLDHTIIRLIKVQQEVISQNLPTDISELTLICKWGCDGSSGQSTYKQKFSCVDQIIDSCDSDLFALSLVPLQLYAFVNDNAEGEGEGTKNKLIFWQNPRPNSTRYCRPIKLLFKKETPALSNEEISKILAQIAELIPTKCLISGGKEISVKQQLRMTMVDGKTVAAVTKRSCQTCNVCGATPKEMNQLSILATKNPDTSTYAYGISTLHAYIRCFECLLHIAYRLDVQTWQIKKDQKQAVKVRQHLIQQRFRLEMGLLVDMPKQGSGTTNDGNTARRFFQNPKLSSDITGIRQEIIEHFAIILETMASGYDVNTNAFKVYAEETLDLYLKNYSWYYMPSSVHKILIHGAAIIKSAILPIGMMSEEAHEARNKHFKKYREEFTRKFSRTVTNEDLLHLLLVTSDPLISSLRKTSPRKSGHLNPTVLSLLSNPSTRNSNDSSD